jgi:hypothetical protein
MPDDPTPAPRHQGVARLASGLLWAFTLAFGVAAVQVGRALWSHKVWMNYRGDVVSLTAMRGEMIFFSLGAIFCALLAWHWHRIWRRSS